MPIQQMLLGVGAVAKKTYVDDVFSTFLYKGAGSTNTITNNIDLTEGGLVWVKRRDGSYKHGLYDTVRGVHKRLSSDANTAEVTDTAGITGFTATGFTTGDANDVNGNNDTYSSWTFRKAPGFFDVVTYTGNNTARTISHSLGSVPGFIMVKATNRTSGWVCWHRELGNTKGLALNSTAAESTPPWNATYWNSTGPTATHFSIGTNADVNHGDSGSEGTYVAYLFAGGESTAATARSVYMFGNSDERLTLGSTSDVTMGTGDFTVECWVNVDSINNEGLFQISSTSGGFDTSQGSTVTVYFGSSDVFKYAANGSTHNTSIKPVIGAWHHVALVRNSGTTSLYVDGTLAGASGDTTNYSGTYLVIGGSYDTSYCLDGHISNFRIVKGTAVYTSAFRPPTAPLTSITNTKLLCCNNASTTGSTTIPSGVSLTSEGFGSDLPDASTDSPFDDPAGFVFGDSGDQNVIKCGSYVGNGSSTGPEINLGWEPQWLLVKCTDGSGSFLHWLLVDNMRGTVTGGDESRLFPNLSNAEDTADMIDFTSTGFKLTSADDKVNTNGDNYIFLAIRRPDGYCGKPPELGTSVFAMDTGTAGSGIDFTSNFPVDYGLMKEFAGTSIWYASSRMTGSKYLRANDTTAEANYNPIQWDYNNGFVDNGFDSTYQSWMWKRHAGFDVVTYKGDDFASGRNIPHSMNKAPEMMWVKDRSASENWYVYHKGHNGGSGPEHWFTSINTDGVEQDHGPAWADTVPTSTHFTVGGDTAVNKDDDNYIAMLFASVDGISKVGSYTGTGSDLDLDLGFTCRFLIIKRTDSSGHWMVFDSVRGINSGNEYFLRLNESDAQTAWTQADWVDPITDGIRIVSADADVNTNTGKYIYYAHA